MTAGIRTAGGQCSYCSLVVVGAARQNLGQHSPANPTHSLLVDDGPTSAHLVRRRACVWPPIIIIINLLTRCIVRYVRPSQSEIQSTLLPSPITVSDRPNSGVLSDVGVIRCRLGTVVCV